MRFQWWRLYRDMLPRRFSWSWSPWVTRADPCFCSDGPVLPPTCCRPRKRWRRSSLPMGATRPRGRRSPVTASPFGRSRAVFFCRRKVVVRFVEAMCVCCVCRFAFVNRQGCAVRWTRFRIWIFGVEMRICSVSLILWRFFRSVFAIRFDVYSYVLFVGADRKSTLIELRKVIWRRRSVYFYRVWFNEIQLQRAYCSLEFFSDNFLLAVVVIIFNVLHDYSIKSYLFFSQYDLYKKLLDYYLNKVPLIMFASVKILVWQFRLWIFNQFYSVSRGLHNLTLTISSFYTCPIFTSY